jgi:hypothetical protein
MTVCQEGIRLPAAQKFISKIREEVNSYIERAVDDNGGQIITKTITRTEVEEEVTIDELCKELNSQYERMHHKYAQSDAQRTSSGNDFSCSHEGSDKALYAGGRFKGECHKCGVIGQKAADCWSRNGNKSSGWQSSKAPPRSDNVAPATDTPKPLESSGGSPCPFFQVTCNYCKRTGHHEAQCDAANAAVASVGPNANYSETSPSPDSFGFTANLEMSKSGSCLKQ